MDIKKYTLSKLKNIVVVDTIEETNDWPESLHVFSWSLGGEIENDHILLVNKESSSPVYCYIVTIMDLFVIRKYFYKKRGETYYRL